MNRRRFLCAAAAAGLAVRSAAGQDKPGGGFRTIAYNIYGADGWPKRRENKWRRQQMHQQIPERLALELALYEPDMVTFSEAPEEARVARIAEALGMQYAYFPGGFSGAALSRFPIIESQNHSLPSADPDAKEPFTRHCGRVVIDMPVGRLRVYSVHLHPALHELRMREIALLRGMLETEPADVPLLLQGDCNHTPDSPEYAQWREAGLEDTAVRGGAEPGGTVTSAKPGGRIDYIWAKGPVARRLKEHRVLYEGAFRLDTGDPGALALSDHLPVMADFA